MIIKSLYLKNIRSYTEQEFFFKEGLTLLSGDIGSGKSSVLLSIEFALFGLIRGSINGSALLRHGCKEGVVKLSFFIEKDFYEVERNLKKTSTGITQDKCFFTKNKEITPLTPLELKSKILELLGYPEDLVSKSKTLIFRYTVYTPQEEMKQIIFESKDERLEKLRKIFGVDKYELIKNNASLYARDLRSELRNYNVVKEEHDSLNENLKELRTKLNLLFEEKDSLTKKINKLNEEEKEIKQRYESAEKEFKTLNELKNKQKILCNEIKTLNNTLKEIEENLNYTNKKLDEKEKEIKEPPEIKKNVEVIKKEILDLGEKKKVFEEKVLTAKNKEAIIKNKIKEIKELLSKVNELETCPTCKQEVHEEHKTSLKEQEDVELKKYEEAIKNIDTFFEKAEEKRKIYDEKKQLLEEELETTRNNEYKQKIYKQLKEYVEETKQKIKQEKEKQEKISQTIKDKNVELQNAEQEINKYKDLEETKQKINKELEQKNKEVREEEKKLSAIQQAIKDKEENTKKIKEDADNKETQLKELNKKKTLEKWISNHFLNLISIIEKQVLTKIHREFNSLFKEWFSMLIEDTELEAEIEQDFSPSITQNGYDSSIENLSGGEKTAVSLAYRLALNKTINDLVHKVKTKGIMILDEPTDGFSSEQLDKVRDVLERTMTKQIIIVSHEAKLESFVNNIIRINKQNHESQTIQI